MILPSVPNKNQVTLPSLYWHCFDDMQQSCYSLKGAESYLCHNPKFWIASQNSRVPDIIALSRCLRAWGLSRLACQHMKPGLAARSRAGVADQGLIS